MEQAIELLKELLLPKLQKDVRFDITKTNGAFWEQMTVAFLDFEKDAKPAHTLLYSLELDTIEKILDQLPNIYLNFIKDLAERFVLGATDEATNHLQASNNTTFLKEVTFYKTLQQAIKHVERNRIKADLPKAADRLTFELSETDIATAIKKKGRDDLKAKFKNWDAEIQRKKTSTVYYSLEPNKKANSKPKVISLSWMKYAVAACFVLGLGVWFFKFNSPEVLPNDNNVVTTTEKDTITEKNPKLKTEPVGAIAYSIKTSKNSIQYPSDFGFTTTDDSKSILVLIKDGSKSIQILEKKFSKTNIDSVRKQLDLLKYQMGKYEFNGKELIIYSSNTTPKTSILSTNDKEFFVKKDNTYYFLYFTKLPLEFKEVKESQLIEQLEKISFENE